MHFPEKPFKRFPVILSLSSFQVNHLKLPHGELCPYRDKEFTGILKTSEPQKHLVLMVKIWASLGLDY